MQHRSPEFAEYLRNPPPDSALARAIAHGIDPTLTFHAMFALTPRERLERAGRVIRMAQWIDRVRMERASRRRESQPPPP
jgi:hypothetical protein